MPGTLPEIADPGALDDELIDGDRRDLETGDGAGGKRLQPRRRRSGSDGWRRRCPIRSSRSRGHRDPGGRGTKARLGALLFELGKSLIGFYLANFISASVYGAAGGVIVLLVWVYYSAQVFLLGAEFTKVWAGHYGSQRNC